MKSEYDFLTDLLDDLFKVFGNETSFEVAELKTKVLNRMRAVKNNLVQSDVIESVCPHKSSRKINDGWGERKCLDCGERFLQTVL